MRSSITHLLLIIATLDLFDCSCDNWAEEDVQSICSLSAKDSLSFCQSKGAADQECSDLASAVDGTKPKCHDASVCSFIKDDKEVYVSCEAWKRGYRILRNCMNDVGVACPDPKEDLSNKTTLRKLQPVAGKGRYVDSEFDHRPICDDDIPKSVDNCQSMKLRNDVLRRYKQRQLGNLCGGFCSIITDKNEEGEDLDEHLRCVMSGTYLDEKTGERDRFRVHLANHGSGIIIMGYWGIGAVRDRRQGPKEKPYK